MRREAFLKAGTHDGGPWRWTIAEEGAIVIIMQRLHESDVSGIALSREMGYTHLNIPMLYEPRILRRR